MPKETISFKGDKEIWRNFSLEAKRKNIEIWDILKPYIERFSIFDHDKIKMCMEAAISEYKRSRLIHHIVIAREVNDQQQDFKQMYYRPAIPISYFQKDKDPIFRAPILPSMGNVVADNEINYLIQEIFENKKIKKIDIIQDKINYQFIITQAGSLGHNTSIILPMEVYLHLFNDPLFDKNMRYEFPEKLMNFNIIPFSNEILNNKIIFIDKSSTIFRYVTTYNPVMGNSEILHIDIGLIEEDGNTDIYVRTLGKLEIYNPDTIKVYQIKNSRYKSSK